MQSERSQALPLHKHVMHGWIGAWYGWRKGGGAASGYAASGYAASGYVCDWSNYAGNITIHDYVSMSSLLGNHATVLLLSAGEGEL